MEKVERLLDAFADAVWWTAASNHKTEWHGAREEARTALLDHIRSIAVASASWQQAVDEFLVDYHCKSDSFATPRDAVAELVKVTGDAALACHGVDPSAQQGVQPVAAADATGRTPQDYAIEHAGYLADAARHLLTSMDHEFDAREALEAAEAADADDAEEKAEDLTSIEHEVGEARRAVSNRIYEFEKRRDRAAASPPAGEQQPAGWLRPGSREPISDALKRADPAMYEHHTIPLYTHPIAATEAVQLTGEAVHAGDAKPQCSQCKHWSREEYGTGYSLGLGRCGAVPMFWESTRWIDDGDGREFTPEAADVTAFAQDGSDYSARLYTRPEHGCTMFAAIAKTEGKDTP